MDEAPLARLLEAARNAQQAREQAAQAAKEAAGLAGHPAPQRER